ncbi:MAG TPA: ABC transporter substrate-binding protein [Gaiellaceae bacterium]|nr:ABC transporter substrate-binding protein [Gaiellaceae bacterium]
MAELPSGTVTFLFTDVEGSTRLLKQLRQERYGQLLHEHRKILREAFAAHGGHEVDTQGDAFFFAFRRAADAALAATDAQRGLAEHAWPDDADCRVRMGIHTGEPGVGDEGYHGLGVHRAARIMAAGHGGQILVSQATCSVLEDDELPAIRIRDLGHHRLKDLDRPEHIYQLDVVGLESEFPPLRTEEAPTAYSGREDELEEAARAAVWRARLGKRHWVVAATAVLVLGGLAALLVGLFGGSDNAHALAQVDSNALGVIDTRTAAIADQVPVGEAPSHIASSEGATWVTNTDDNTVSRVDPGTKNVQTIPVGNSPSGIAAGDGAVWVANSLDGTVSRIDPGTNQVVQTIDVGNGPVGIAYGAGSVWVANTGDATITRIDAESGRPATPLPVAATELAFGGGALWATQRATARVVRIDPASGDVVQPIAVGNGPSGIAVGDGSVWVANNLDGTVTQIDPVTSSVEHVIPTGNGPASIAVNGRGVWVSNQFDGTVVRIDPRTGQRAQTIRVGNRPQGLALSAGDVLVAVRESGTGHRGGTLTVRMNRDLDFVDPAVAYDTTSIPILRMTNDGLVAFNQAGGLAGTQLVPDLAVALPTPADGGKTYTFRLRSGIRYSNGQPVRASDFRRSFERDFAIGKLPVTYYDGIVGAAQCKEAPTHCDLSRGVVADDAARTVTFHLTAPDPEFLYQLALEFAYAVPSTTRLTQTHTKGLPGTGPYVIASYRPNHQLVLRRNPYFHEWSKAAQPDGYPDRIVFRIGGTPDAAMNDVIAGKADAFSTAQSQTPPTASRLAAVKLGHASQVHSNPQQATIAFFLNTRLPPFDRLAARKALNLAVDRSAAVAVTGGSDVSQATCQILPPHFPGYRPYCPFGTKPDLARARALVAASGTKGMTVKFYSWGDIGGLGPYAAKLLRSLGYRTSVRKIGSIDSFFATTADSRTRAQIGTTEWITDYPTAGGFFNPIFTCASFQPRTTANSNTSEFCDRHIDRQIARALRLEATDPDTARRIWERVDRETVDQAPWVPLVNPKEIDILSKRVGNYQYSPNGYGMIFDQLWVR